MRSLPVACIQAEAHDREAFARAFPALLAQVARAGESGARLIVLPEGSVPAYVLGDEPVDPALVARAQDDLAALARRHGAVIVYGSARTLAGVTYNTASVLGPDGDLLGAPAKHFLWHFDRRWFAAGKYLQPVDTPVGRLGVLVCADGRIPTIARTLVQRGAELLVMPTAWVTSGRDPEHLENAQADLLAFVRAHENGVPFLAANKCGFEAGVVAYCGKSVVVDAGGRMLAQASERRAEVLRAELSIGAPAAHAAHAEGLLAAALYLADRPGGAREPERRRVRIAFTTESDPAALTALARTAAATDATLLLAPGLPNALPPGFVAFAALDAGESRAGDLPLTVLPVSRLRDPAVLVPGRLAGIDLALFTGFDASDAVQLRLVRARALELRIYVVAFDRRGGRAVAVDPDGVVVAGTFGDLRLAAFAYDPARTSATEVAPSTDVLDGLRAADPHYRAALRERFRELEPSS